MCIRDSYSADEFKKIYAQYYMEALSVKSTTKKHSDVLFHILGFLKKIINSEQKSDIIKSIERYKEGVYPLIVPITLLKHYISIHKISYIKDQIYLHPYPYNLSLRNHV